MADDLLGLPKLMPCQESENLRNGRIIVVDDNADMRDYLRRLLSSRWDVEITADGTVALEMTKRLRPGILLADVIMPGLDGFELLKRIREDAELKYTPVILVTARAGEEAAIQGPMAGADDYIAKPFSLRELVARVRAVINRTRAEAALRESEQSASAAWSSLTPSRLGDQHAGEVVVDSTTWRASTGQTLRGMDRLRLGQRDSSRRPRIRRAPVARGRRRQAECQRRVPPEIRAGRLALDQRPCRTAAGGGWVDPEVDRP